MGPVLMVVNPRSQNGALGRQWGDVARTLRRELGSFEEAMTEGPGDATRLTRDALRGGCGLVVAVGGDGTLHEVANGFFDDAGAPLAPAAALRLVPSGPGGASRKPAGPPRHTAAAARLLKEGARRAIDVGELAYAEGGGGGPR